MITTIIFDLGGVLIDWNPMYVFKNLIPDDDKRKYFFENICTPHWNEEQDGGRALAEATEMLVVQFPDWELEIRAFYGRWEEMLGGAIAETVEILKTLKQNPNLSIYALTNWSAETWPVAIQRFEFLSWFEGILVSGVEHTRKPFPEIYQLMLDRYNIIAQDCIFIDDNLRNVEAAKMLGINALQFLSAPQLKDDLKQFGIEV